MKRWIKNRDFERAERTATYVVLTLLIAGEALAAAVPALDDLLQRRGEIILLAIALLLVFRIIARQVENVSDAHRTLTSMSLADATSAAMRHSGLLSEVVILANDASKYYHLLSEVPFTVNRIRLLVHDPHSAKRWTRLQQRGLVGSLEVRTYAADPVFHLLTVDDKAAILGSFVRLERGAPTTGGIVLATGADSAGRELVSLTRQIFESLWNDPTTQPVIIRSTEANAQT